MIQRNKKWVVDMGWQVLFKDLGVSARDLFRHARLPLDLFSRNSPTLTTEEYFRLWESLAHLLREDPAFPLRIGQSISVESFSPPVFACFCSPDLNVALSRLSQYKPLIGPMRLDITQNDQQTVVTIAGLPENSPLPSSLIAMELVFMVHLARLAIRERIVPKAVRSTMKLPELGAYEAFFGTRVELGAFNGVAFTAEDARRPFLTANESMWSVFEPELRTRMDDLDMEAGFRDRVRACLVEILASGQCATEDVARRLAVSTRTLQRRLRDEGTSFQAELRGLREELARHYLSNSHYSGAEISFLLGYKDPNSFFRAFHTWTGQTPELARSRMQQH